MTKTKEEHKSSLKLLKEKKELPFRLLEILYFMMNY